MKKIFIINGGQKFAHSGGSFNNTITKWTKKHLKQGFEIKITNINDDFNWSMKQKILNGQMLSFIISRFGGFRFRIV
jgi:hypothetical protein